jgi:hypothetical protein
VDPRLHHLQGEAEFVKPQALVDLLREFASAKLALKRRHEAGAQRVGTYDVNNGYQYMIAREESHLDWLHRAIHDLGGAPPADSAALPVPSGGKGPDTQAAILADDAQVMRAFLDRWQGAAEHVDDARQRRMLQVILGEMLEQKRFLDQAVAGRHDLLGRRTGVGEVTGTVLSTRWVE